MSRVVKMNIMVALVHVVERMNPYRCSIRASILSYFEFRVNSCNIFRNVRVTVAKLSLCHLLIEKILMQLKYILLNK